MITLNITLVLVWILIGMSIYYKYYNIHVWEMIKWNES